jgi:putative tryptophan/tyrosine transport system substrate-binding protein
LSGISGTSQNRRERPETDVGEAFQYAYLTRYDAPLCLLGGRDMKRREFITLLGGAAATWPVAVHAQQPDQMKRIGVLMGGSENPETRDFVAALKKGCANLGWIEGLNAQMEVRWAGGDVATMRTQAVELVAWRPDVVVTQATPATLAFRETTRIIANVFVAVADPVGAGIAESISHPAGNSTGFVNFEPTIAGKWLELLREAAPKITHVAMLLNPKTYPGGLGGVQVRFAQSAAPSLNMTVVEAPFLTAGEIESTLAGLGRDPTAGLLVMPDTSTNVHGALIIELARRNRIVAIYPYAYYARIGGLFSYGTELSDLYRQAAGYVDRILRSEKPGDLPVQSPTKYTLAINLKTAQELGLDISPSLLARADEVIE